MLFNFCNGFIQAKHLAFDPLSLKSALSRSWIKGARGGVEACPQFSVGEAGVSERKRCSKPTGSRLRLKMSNKIISNHLAVYMR
jgi:hypothetical protein